MVCLCVILWVRRKYNQSFLAKNQALVFVAISNSMETYPLHETVKKKNPRQLRVKLLSS